MDNKLEVAQKPMNFNELVRMSDAFAKSGLFPDIKSAASAMVKIQAGIEMGIKPFAAMTGIHIISGKPTAGAGIIASRIKASSKYDYTILESTDTACSIDFYENGKMVGNSSFTAVDAERAKTQNMAKFPRNMLFARAISNGCKWYTPDVFDCAVYTEYEIEETPADTPQKVNTTDKELERFTTLVNKCTTLSEVEKLFESAITDEERKVCKVRAKEIVAATPEPEPIQEAEIVQEVYVPIIDIINEIQDLPSLKKIAALVVTPEERNAYDTKFKQLKTK